MFPQSKFRNLLRLAAPLLLSLLSAPGFAVVVKNLHEAEVPVADHGKPALAAASKVALSEVLVKVSGSVEVLQNPSIAAQLGKARTYVQQYSYTRDQDAQGDLTARFEFDDSVISRLITEAGAPLWIANRPPVLTWLVVQGTQGRQFVNWELAPQVMKAIKDGFAKRGVPVRFPLYDLEDSSSLAVEQAWRLQASPVFMASQRYDVQHILVGRVTGLSTGEWVGDWSYLRDGDRVDRSVSAGTVDIFLGEGVSLVAEEMAGKYAVATSGVEAGGVPMSVAGVDSYADYAKIVSWLEGLELIDHANVEAIVGDKVQLRLMARADAVDLKTIIELNRNLVPLAQGPEIEQLSYQWKN